MMSPPQYFESIRQSAAKRWDQLEADPDLAGPWHQLFKQVQSPRHVLSELLQNADDAGATETSVRIENGYFLFNHNGEDFTEEHFTSLCRFGYSNKRALHTIGFRGIGFKSIFSLGDTVELLTPTLSVSFGRRRFTEPNWLPGAPAASGTKIRISIREERLEREITKNLDDWITSPLSLLFFKCIRQITVGERKAQWETFGPGPVPDSDWMALNGDADQEFLVVRSGNEPFPEDALAEIRQERLLRIDQESDFPPSRVEIVLGAKGQLYVVLPTGVVTELPFACNAPFIQDPARLKIKDPEISPTNRWLLERVGKLAASVMLQWIQQKRASVAERSRAYGIMPDVDQSDRSLEGICATTVEKAFGGTITSQPFLLTNCGDLKPAKESVIVPDELLEVWPEEHLTIHLDRGNLPALSRYISIGDRQKLLHWRVIEQVTTIDLFNVLLSKHLPKPESWSQLLKLWVYIAPEIGAYRFPMDHTKLRILPVQGKDVLYSASEVVRLGEKRLLASDNDWDFLAAHLLVLNPNWPRFLTEQRRSSDDQFTGDTGENVRRALAVLDVIGLNDTTDVSKVIERVAAEFFVGQLRLADCVQVARIAAKLGATLAQSFRFVTQDQHLRSTSDVLLHDPDGTLAALLPENWSSAHLLHSDYWVSFTSCTSDEWLRWISSGRAGLLGFPRISPQYSNEWSRLRIETELRRRGFRDGVYYPYVTNEFGIEDWDFEEKHWKHWAALAEGDPTLWGRICERILQQPGNFWSHAESARVIQIATNGKRRSVTSDPLLPIWILRLRELPCLPDTRGFHRRPSELLLRTPETEPFMDVEHFAHGRVDNEKTRPLLTLLGVHKTPTNPERLVDCLRALAKAESAPAQEVDKWYRRLDQMINSCSTADLANIKKAFREEPIVLAEGGAWTTALGVFVASDDEDLPGAEVIRPSVRDLALWNRLGVAERPTVDLAIQWLAQLPSGSVLSLGNARRVRALLPLHSVRIWNECGHWLNLAVAWVPTATLRYSLTMQSLVSRTHLHEWVKQQTADLQSLQAEISQAPPFSCLPSLASSIEERLNRQLIVSSPPAMQPWLSQLGADLQRLVADEDTETVYIRGRGAKLSATLWQSTQFLELIPYIGGVPAGTPRSAEAIWLDNVLYVKNRPASELAMAVSLELGRVFRRPDIVEAIKFCFDRPPKFVTEYLEANFTLVRRDAERSSEIPLGGSTTIGVDASSKNNEFSRPAELLTETRSATTSDEMSLHAALDDHGQIALDGGLHITQEVDLESPPQRDRIALKPGKLSIMERFARIHGFTSDNTNRFLHPDGSSIDKPPSTRFWERRNAKGELVKYYYPRDHCLEREPLTVDADVWNMIDRFPDTHALILSDAEDEAVELTGARLRAMRNDDAIKLYPATYRLVYDDGQRSAEPVARHFNPGEVGTDKA
jgi:hypothetical protein